MLLSHSAAPIAAPAAARASYPLAPGCLVDALSLGAVVLLPVALALALAASLAAATGRAWDAAGTLAWLGGVLFAHAHDRLAASRRRGDDVGNPRREALVGRRRSWFLVAGVVGAAAVLAAVAAAPSRVLVPVLALALTFVTYPWLSRLPLGKSLAVAACWAGGAATLPLRGGAAPSLPIAGALGLLVLSGAVLCDLKDRAADGRQGIRSLPVIVGPEVARAAAAVAAVAGASLAAWAGPGGLWPAALGLALLAARPRLVERDVVGPALVDACLSAVALSAVL